MRNHGLKVLGATAFAFALLFGNAVRAGEAVESEVMLLMPVFEPEHGRALFGGKGCVVCHSVNGIGGEEGPALDYDPANGPLNLFEIAADMWDHAATMVPLQKEDLGQQITLGDKEFADLVGFLASPAEQKKFSLADVPPNMKELLEKEREEDGEKEQSSD